MNVYALIIFGTLVFSYLLTLLVDHLNLKSLSRNIPAEFAGVYSPEKYASSQEYTAVRTRFSLLTASVDLVIFAAFWFFGGFNLLDEYLRGYELGNVLTGLIYLGILLFARMTYSLPFSLYSTFVIEEKFGFNKTTVGTFIVDMIKGLLLGLILGAPLLAGVLSFFEYLGELAWLYVWGAITVYMLIMQFIAPTWIMPLFNKFTPLEDGELRTSIMDYAKSVDFSLDNVFIIDGSRRSAKSNAFFTGFGKNKRIALFDTLVAQHTTEELTAVLAHEIGHYKKKHIFQGMLLGVVQTGVLFFLLSIFLNHQGLFDAFFMTKSSVYAGLLFFGMLYSPIEMLLGIFMQIFSRKNEFEADRFATETIQEPEAMIRALKKLSEHNLSNLTPHPLNVFLNYSHPPVLERIRAIRKVVLGRV